MQSIGYTRAFWVKGLFKRIASTTIVNVESKSSLIDNVLVNGEVYTYDSMSKEFLVTLIHTMGEIFQSTEGVFSDCISTSFFNLQVGGNLARRYSPIHFSSMLVIIYFTNRPEMQILIEKGLVREELFTDLTQIEKSLLSEEEYAIISYYEDYTKNINVILQVVNNKGEAIANLQISQYAQALLYNGFIIDNLLSQKPYFQITEEWLYLIKESTVETRQGIEGDGMDFSIAPTDELSLNATNENELNFPLAPGNEVALGYTDNTAYNLNDMLHQLSLT